MILARLAETAYQANNLDLNVSVDLNALGVALSDRSKRVKEAEARLEVWTEALAGGDADKEMILELQFVIDELLRAGDFEQAEALIGRHIRLREESVYEEGGPWRRFIEGKPEPQIMAGWSVVVARQCEEHASRSFADIDVFHLPDCDRLALRLAREGLAVYVGTPEAAVASRPGALSSPDGFSGAWDGNHLQLATEIRSHLEGRVQPRELESIDRLAATIEVGIPAPAIHAGLRALIESDADARNFRAQAARLSREADEAELAALAAAFVPDASEDPIALRQSARVSREKAIEAKDKVSTQGQALPEIALDDLLNVLDANEAAVVFSPAATLVLRREGVTIEPSAISSREMRQVLRRLRVGLEPPAEGRLSSVDLAAAHQLWKALFGPIESAVNSASRVWIVAPGIFASVPFEALLPERPDTDTWSIGDRYRPKWAIYSYQFSLVPTLSTIVQLSVTPRSHAPRAFLGLGNPVLSGGGTISSIEDVLYPDGTVNSDKLRTLEPLPGALTEIKAIAEALPPGRSRTIEGIEFTSTKLADLDWYNYRTIVFATHGLVATADAPIRQLLVLTQHDANDPGILAASEVSEIVLDADLVVLSACNTGPLRRGVQRSGLAGFADRFMAAGARTVIVSRWPLLSNNVELLTKPAITAAVADGPGAVGVALRDGILRVLEDNSKPEQHHPAFWASLVVVGGVRSSDNVQ